MKLQQLHYIREVAKHGLNVSATAERLVYFPVGDQQTDPHAGG